MRRGGRYGSGICTSSRTMRLVSGSPFPLDMSATCRLHGALSRFPETSVTGRGFTPQSQRPFGTDMAHTLSETSNLMVRAGAEWSRSMQGAAKEERSRMERSGSRSAPIFVRSENRARSRSRSSGSAPGSAPQSLGAPVRAVPAGGALPALSNFVSSASLNFPCFCREAKHPVFNSLQIRI